MERDQTERELFEACLQASPEARSELLAQCEDSSLAERVGRLLEAHENAERMPSQIGTVAIEGLLDPERVGPYRILERLGEGGMGVVYVAEQLEPLRRRVALKVVKPGMDTRQVLARFETERQALALMDHPAIARVFEAGATEEGRPYFVMELVKGLTITDHCDRYRLSLEERLALFLQVCAGVQHAHNRAVVHRDLKPSNILVALTDGEASPKIIDFGVAKATGGALGERTVHTQWGAMLGTPAYMSPEQADSANQDVDGRSDVYSLGVVLFELLVGAQPFSSARLMEQGLDGFARRLRDSAAPRPSTRITRDSEEATLAAGLRRVSVATLKRQLTGDLDRIVLTAMAKEQAERYESPRELARDIERFLENQPVDARASRRSSSSSATRSGPSWWSVALLLLAIGFAVWGRGSRAPELPSRLSFHLPPDQALYPHGLTNLAISPDAAQLAWVGGRERRLFVREVNAFEARGLEGTDGAAGPFFSPDGEWVGFFRRGALMKVPTSGGGVVTIASTASKTIASRGASWGEDDWIVFSPHFTAGLLRVRASGGPVEAVTELDHAAGERTHRWPSWLPGAERVLFTRDASRTEDYYDDADIVSESILDGSRSVVVEGASQALYAQRHVVFARGGKLYAQPWDPRSGKGREEARLLQGQIEADASTGASMFALARDGSLAWAPGISRERFLQLAWIAGEEDATPLELEPGNVRHARVAPDGNRIVYVATDEQGSDLWIFDLQRNTTSRITQLGTVRSPVWGAGGESILFGTNAGVFEVRVGSTAAPELLASADAGNLMPTSLLPDGQTLLAVLNRPGLQWDIVQVDLADGTVSDWLATSASEGELDLHPGGDWLAFCSDRSGSFEVYLTRLDQPELQLTVSKGMGCDAQWSPAGDKIYYLHPITHALWEVEVTLDPEPVLGPPRQILDLIYAEDDVHQNYDVAPDGRLLVRIDSSAREVGREIRLHRGWQRE